MSRRASYSNVPNNGAGALLRMPSAAEFFTPTTSPTHTGQSRSVTESSEPLPGYKSPIRQPSAYTGAVGYDAEKASGVAFGRPTSGQRVLNTVAGAFNYIIQKQLFVIRLPYCGLYRHYIEKPTKELEVKIRNVERDTVSTTILHLAKWREKILEQLTIVIVSCTLIITADIAALAWPSLSPDEKEGTPGRPDLWITIAMLHSSLVLSVSSILLALQQQGILKSQEITTSIDREKNAMAAETPKIAPPQGHWYTADEYERERLQALLDQSLKDERLDNLKKRPTREEAEYESERISMAERMIRLVLAKDKKSEHEHRQFKVSGFRLYVWQAPAMLMSYAACQFVGGFALHVISPLFLVGSTGWTPDAKTAVIVLIMGVFSLFNFVLPSWLLNGRYLEWKREDSERPLESK